MGLVSLYSQSAHLNAESDAWGECSSSEMSLVWVRADIWRSDKDHFSECCDIGMVMLLTGMWEMSAVGRSC